MRTTRDLTLEQARHDLNAVRSGRAICPCCGETMTREERRATIRELERHIKRLTGQRR